MNFFRSLRAAQSTEFAVAKFLCAMVTGATFFLSSRTEPADYDFGIKVGERAALLCEVKEDFKSASTGNIFVETGNPRSGSPSGLSKTTCDRWLYVLHQSNTLLSFDPQDMRSYLEQCPDCRKKEVAGAGNAAGFTIPLSTLRKQPFVKEFRYDG